FVPLQTDPAAKLEHNRTCRPRIARRARAVATGTADRRNLDAASRRCARVAELRSKTGPARHRDGRDLRRECVWRETDPGSDLSPGQVRRSASRHCTHPLGGGFVMGTPKMKDVENRLFASELKCAIYSVDYRLAPEAPHPAPLEDIYSVFVWLHANAGQLGLDPTRIGIKGESGGGGFATSAALY